MTPSLLKTLIAAGRRRRVEPYFVGGPVRDLLLGRRCHDWDIVSRQALPLARLVAKSVDGKLITLDDRNKIYRVIVPSPYPLPKGRGPTALGLLPLGEGARRADEGLTIDFAEMQGKDIQEDLARRDFTINAMAQSLLLPLPAGEGWGEAASSGLRPSSPEGRRNIIDPFGGQRDLQRKIIRAVSSKAFREDPLRLVRAFRFAAQFGFSIERKTLKWIMQGQAGLMGKVARERIREEWLRLLQQPQAHASLRLMDRTGLLTVIFPDMETCRSVGRRYYGKGGVLKHSLQTVENLEAILADIPQRLRFLPSNVRAKIGAYVEGKVGGFPRLVWLKFAGFLHDIGKPATAQVLGGRLRFFGHEDVGSRMSHRILRGLRCSRQEEQIVSTWVQNHMRPGNLAAAIRVSDKAIARFFRDQGEDGVGMLLVSLADHYGYLPKTQWGKGADPVEKTAALLLNAYYNKREQVLPVRVINGHILMKKLRLKPGPLIGKLLSKIQDAQVGGKVKTEEEALTYARFQIKKAPHPPSGRGPKAPLM